jgi:heparan-alpha-glucosaminide N-acetyltransferase
VQISPGRGRVESLDAFRGICIAVMIFVNYGGGGYWFFDHSKWNGLTVADLVFPWFIWIMGTAMALSFTSLENRRARRVEMLAKVVRRSIILFGLGLFLNNGWDLDHWRIPGVLQRFAISYLCVALIIMYVPKWSTTKIRIRNIHENTSFTGVVGGVLADVTPYWVQWVVTLLILTLFLLLTFLINVPGCGRGYLGPGGIGDYGEFYNCTGNSFCCWFCFK